MTDPLRPDDAVASREKSASRALAAYRERRRVRRGEDTYFGSSELLRVFLEEGFPVEELDHRRGTLIEEALDDGMPLDLAELLHDIAWEEGLDPAIGFELVRTGLGVAPPNGGVSNAASAPATDKYLPAWIFPATLPDRLLRERMLRLSFRRLRSFLQSEENADEAFRRFAGEPDVGHFGY